MLIANPIYDTAFKYLLEDVNIAKGIISLIIGEEITNLELRPQETTAELFEAGIRVFRLDFKATIRTKEGKLKKVLIELQKSKEIFDIQRFRRYLGQNYFKGDTLHEEEAGYESLPIITIYFLGFKLTHVPYAVVKVGRDYTDVLSGKKIEKPLDEEFLDLLTHECYTIQIPRLKKKLKSELERVLSVFALKKKSGNKRMLIAEEDIEEKNDLFSKIISRLNRAVSSEALREKMDLEEEVETLLEKQLRKFKQVSQKLEMYTEKLETQHKEILEKDKILTEKDKTLTEKDKMLTEKDKTLTEQEQKLAEERLAKEAALAELENLKKLLKDKH